MHHSLLDEKYMKMAISLAKRGAGQTSPNPQVGAVLVKNKKIVASDYHKRAGLMHAEALAIKKACKNALGSTLYCTLEACTHYGKTPPCVDTIIKNGIKRAVFAMRDPNPINYNKGITKLKLAGIETICGVLENEARDLNRPFIKFMTRRMPYITIKMAQSLDGKIADTCGRSRWITSLLSRRFAHKLRGQNDAVMVGVNTLLRDNPILTYRSGSRNIRQPLRIILDTNLRTPLTSRILKKNKKDGGKVLIVAGEDASLKKKTLLERKGANVVMLPKKGERIDLVRLMRYLALRDVTSVLCEGGGELAASLLKDGLADELLFFISPRIIGGRTAPTSCGGLKSNIHKSIRLKDVKMEWIGHDILIRGYL